MLHRQEPQGLICITQNTHAWVSGQLARAWGNEDFGSFAPWEQVCLATEQHDISWLKWEEAPTLNPKTGYPHSFLEVSTAVHVGLWRSAKQAALPFGRYVALLVSLHGTGLYERYRGWQKSPDSTQLVQNFLDQEYPFQEQLTATLQHDSYYAPYATPEAIANNRQLVALWDSLSLALCHGLHSEYLVDRVPIASGETTIALTPSSDDPQSVTVSPWPFRTSAVTLVYEGRLLQKTFTDEEAMREALRSAPWIAIATTLKPA